MQARLAGIPGLTISSDVPLALHTRFAVGGNARTFADASTESALVQAVAAARESGETLAVIGGGTNLVASDEGFPGVILRYTGAGIAVDRKRVEVAAGAVLQDLVDTTIRLGLRGLETMTGIPGWVGGAIYGNAGAYGHSIQERVHSVRFFDGNAVREIANAACEFDYRESVFKRHKRPNQEWIILSASLDLDPADPAELQAAAGAILRIRNEKYPPSMHCAGSIFKNLFFDRLPAPVRADIPVNVVREGKIPSAYLLEQVGAKGMTNGGVRVAEYHANLIFNAGGGTASEIRDLIADLKRRVRGRFGIQLEEEVQYL